MGIGCGERGWCHLSCPSGSPTGGSAVVRPPLWEVESYVCRRTPLGQDQASKGPVPYPKRWSRRQGYAFVTNMAEPPRGDSSVLAYTVTPLGRLPCVLHPKKGDKRPYRSILSAHPAAGNTKENYALKVGPLWPPCSLLCQAAHCGPAGRAPGPAPIGAYGTCGHWRPTLSSIRCGGRH